MGGVSSAAAEAVTDGVWSGTMDTDAAECPSDAVVTLQFTHDVELELVTAALRLTGARSGATITVTACALGDTSCVEVWALVPVSRQVDAPSPPSWDESSTPVYSCPDVVAREHQLITLSVTAPLPPQPPSHTLILQLTPPLLPLFAVRCARSSPSPASSSTLILRLTHPLVPTRSRFAVPAPAPHPLAFGFARSSPSPARVSLRPLLSLTRSRFAVRG